MPKNTAVTSERVDDIPLLIAQTPAPPSGACVTFQEDQTRMTHPAMGRAMACINNLVIGLLNRHGFGNHAQARRQLDADPAQALALILGL